MNEHGNSVKTFVILNWDFFYRADSNGYAEVRQEYFDIKNALSSRKVPFAETYVVPEEEALMWFLKRRIQFADHAHIYSFGMHAGDWAERIRETSFARIMHIVRNPEKERCGQNYGHVVQYQPNDLRAFTGADRSDVYLYMCRRDSISPPRLDPLFTKLTMRAAEASERFAVKSRPELQFKVLPERKYR